MKAILYIVLVVGVMGVVLLLGFGGDRLTPFASMILMVVALMLFVAIGLRSGVGNRIDPAAKSDIEARKGWAYTQPLPGDNWLDLVVSHEDMTRHISLEIDRSRRFDRTFTVVVIAPDMKALALNGVVAASTSELNTMRVFVQEVVVRQLRTTDVISNSVMPAVTISLLPETDSDGTDIAVARIRDALTSSALTLGSGGQTELTVSVMAVNYPADVRDTMGFIESIKEFEDRVSADISAT